MRGSPLPPPPRSSLWLRIPRANGSARRGGQGLRHRFQRAEPASQLGLADGLVEHVLLESDDERRRGVLRRRRRRRRTPRLPLGLLGLRAVCTPPHLLLGLQPFRTPRPQDSDSDSSWVVSRRLQAAVLALILRAQVHCPCMRRRAPRAPPLRLLGLHPKLPRLHAAVLATSLRAFAHPRER